jgi:molecular chaperone GrpE (heat shock protein)
MQTNGAQLWKAINDDVTSLVRDKAILVQQLQESERKSKEEMRKFLLELIEVLDAFDRVFANIAEREQEQPVGEQARGWIGNFRGVRRQLERKLKAYGVVAIADPPDRLARLGFHVVVETREASGLPNDTILEEVQKGYLYHSEVLRKSHVIAVKNN